MATIASNLPVRRPAVATAGPLLVQFAYLQTLDILTTLAFLLAGVQEGNPMVREAIRATGSPLFGLMAVKAAAVLLAGFCWWSGRLRLLQRANVCFAILVAWNLMCLILGLGRRF